MEKRDNFLSTSWSEAWERMLDEVADYVTTTFPELENKEKIEKIHNVLEFRLKRAKIIEENRIADALEKQNSYNKKIHNIKEIK